MNAATPRSRPAKFWTLGVDIGQAQDHSAINVVESVPDATDPRRRTLIHRVRYVKRLPLDIEYKHLVTEVLRVATHEDLLGKSAKALSALADMPLPKVYVTIDGTGQGRPIIEAFRDKYGRRGVVPVNITRGEVTSRADDGWWNVPKGTLISVMRVLLADRRLRIAKDLEWADELKAELLNFREKPGATEDRFEAEEGEKDDLVMSLAMACWWAEHVVGKMAGAKRPRKKLKPFDPKKDLGSRPLRSRRNHG